MTNGQDERRATGVHKVSIPDGSGGREELIQVNVGRAQMWLNVLKAAVALMLMIAGAMWGAVRFGVQAEVHEEVETQFEEEMKAGGKIDTHMHEISMEAIEEVQGVIQDDLDVYDRRLKDIEDLGGDLKAGQEAAQSERERNSEELKMLIQRAIDSGGGSG